MINPFRLEHDVHPIDIVRQKIRATLLLGRIIIRATVCEG